jgi:hypothetical protein
LNMVKSLMSFTKCHSIFEDYARFPLLNWMERHRNPLKLDHMSYGMGRQPSWFCLTFSVRSICKVFPSKMRFMLLNTYSLCYRTKDKVLLT